ncbi:MAG: RNA-binding S4 domain-containing protein [Granulosicoccaceae bacterium]
MTSNEDLAQHLTLREEPVELYKILKFGGFASSGAEAKIRISEGDVRVNGEVETRKRRKMLAGDDIVIDGNLLMLKLEDAS